MAIDAYILPFPDGVMGFRGRQPGAPAGARWSGDPCPLRPSRGHRCGPSGPPGPLYRVSGQHHPLGRRLRRCILAPPLVDGRRPPQPGVPQPGRAAQRSVRRLAHLPGRIAGPTGWRGAARAWLASAPVAAAIAPPARCRGRARDAAAPPRTAWRLSGPSPAACAARPWMCSTNWKATALRPAGPARRDCTATTVYGWSKARPSRRACPACGIAGVLAFWAVRHRHP